MPLAGDEMQPEQRKMIIGEVIRRAMGQDNPFLRLVSFEYAGPGGGHLSATVDCQQAGTTALVVRTESLGDEDVALLKRRGFEELEDPDTMRTSAYVRVEEGMVPLGDLVTFVDWVFIALGRAPGDYMPDVRPLGSAENKRSCAPTAALMVLGLAAVAALLAVL